MKKNIWIWNHYATIFFWDQEGRHYWFAENLIEQGYNATIFCAATIHNPRGQINTGDRCYAHDSVNGIPFVFVKTPYYVGNGKQRILNMIAFYRNLFRVSREYAALHGKPDVIVASSVHPLTLIAGIRIAKKFGVPCICEVRDLWPESLVAYGTVKQNSLLAKALYQGEKWIYRKADALIMTWEGGKDYIRDRGWDKAIDLSKVKHISNGVLIEAFDRSSSIGRTPDPDLDDENFKNMVYLGSVRKVNNLGMLLDAAKIISGMGLHEIRFLIYGSGDESDMLKRRCEDEGICNVIMKGWADKKTVPSILKRATVIIIHNSSTSLDRYGQSQNKFFEALAAGKCIVQTYSSGFSICQKYDCGINVPVQNAQEIAKAVIQACQNDVANRRMGNNARRAALDYDFRKLTAELIDLIERV